MRRMTPASPVRLISGSVNAGRAAKLCSSYRRTQMPSRTRPQRPLRWSALACEMASICRRVVPVRGS